ncbi:MAG: peptidoglycan DD-metalloendopeptidase family protein [Actinobacteria bacterium]|nr:peptidoglycan DD-metalloendopeptidase family protein [Actinomycetota bacterium]
MEPPLPPGGFLWPASGQVTSGWSLDCRTDRGHRGIDIAVAQGDPILASGSGVVAFAGYTPAEGGGITVCIDHDGGMRTTYLHLAQLRVSQGQVVSNGQQLAVSDGSPLHFGMKVTAGREAYFNPVALLATPEPSTVSPGPADSDSITGTDPALATPESDPATSQPAAGSSTVAEPVNAADNAITESVAIPDSQTVPITTPASTTAASLGDLDGIDIATLPTGPEMVAVPVTLDDPASSDAGRLSLRFSDGSFSRQQKPPNIDLSGRRPSTSISGVSPTGNLLLAGLLILATTGSGLFSRAIRQKPAPAC